MGIANAHTHTIGLSDGVIFFLSAQDDTSHIKPQSSLAFCGGIFLNYEHGTSNSGKHGFLNQDKKM